MMIRKLVSICFLVSSQLCFGSDGTEISYGVAINEAGQVVYREKHTSEFSQGDLKKLKTEYFVEDGNYFGSINSNFVKNSYIPTYQFEDSRHGREAGVQWKNDQVIAYAKDMSFSQREEKSFDVNNNTVAGQGLHNFLRVNLNEFVKNKDHQRQIKFLIPMNQDIYTFRIRSKEVDVKKGIVKIRIEADSWLFRLVAPHIDVTYEIGSNRLLEYKGPSNLLTNDKKHMNVTIAYRYPNPKNKKGVR